MPSDRDYPGSFALSGPEKFLSSRCRKCFFESDGHAGGDVFIVVKVKVRVCRTPVELSAGLWLVI